MLQTVKAERANLSTAPICSKGDNTHCYKSVQRVQAVMKKDYMREKSRLHLSSGDTRILSTLGSDDLKSDGVMPDDELLLSAPASR